MTGLRTSLIAAAFSLVYAVGVGAATVERCAPSARNMCPAPRWVSPDEVPDEVLGTPAPESTPRD